METIESSERRLVSPELRLNAIYSLGYQVMDKPQEHMSQNRYTFNFLTDREREVLRLVADGHTDRMVAETLVISIIG